MHPPAADSSKWSKVRNAFLTREEIQFEEPPNNSSTTISSPSSPVRNSASFFAEEEIGKKYAFKK